MKTSRFTFWVCFVVTVGMIIMYSVAFYGLHKISADFDEMLDNLNNTSDSILKRVKEIERLTDELEKEINNGK